MSELRNRMIRDMQLAGLVEGTRREYLRAVRQLTAYSMVSPDRLSERNVEDAPTIISWFGHELRMAGEPSHLTTCASAAGPAEAAAELPGQR